MGSFKLGKMTIRSVFSKPETTCYPEQTKPPVAGLKGSIANDMDVCILCGICEKVCPAQALTVDKKARSWTINRFRCVQCASCTRSCPKQCLSMLPHYAKVSTSKHEDVFFKPTEPDKDPQAKEAEKAAKIEAALKAKAEREKQAV